MVNDFFSLVDCREAVQSGGPRLRRFRILTDHQSLM
jgi:hypothetical protein